MRKPSEYVASAIRRVRDSILAESAKTLVHGESSASVTLVGSPRQGEDAMMATEPVEVIRVLALASDFPAIRKWDAVTLGGEFRIVTSATVGIGGSSLTLGLSEHLEKFAATLTGVRGVRRIVFPLGLLASCGGKADVPDGYGTSEVYSWTIAIHRDDWGDATPPQVGDEIRFEKDGDRLVHLSRVTDIGQYFVCQARSRT